MQSLQFRAMNTDILLAVEGQDGSEKLLQQARSQIEDFERRFSRFLPDSELSRLNANAGQWMHVSDDLLDLLVLARAYYEETGGLFDPAVLPDLKRAGYDASLEIVQLRDGSQVGGDNGFQQNFQVAPNNGFSSMPQPIFRTGGS